MARPYVAAYVDMDEGVRIFGQIADVEAAQLRIGARVQVDFRQTPGNAPEVVAYAFIPAPEEQA